MKRASRILAGSLLALALSSAAHAQFYNLANTDMLAVTGLSYDGSRAVGVNGDNTPFYMWTAATGVQTGVGDFIGGVATISADGNTVGFNGINPASGNRELALYNWNSGATTYLGSLGQTSDRSDASSMWALSGDGKTAVGLAWVSGSNAHAITATTAGVVDLGSSVAGRSTRANAVSYDGSVVGGWQDTNGPWQGAIWKNGVQTLLTSSDGTFVGAVNGLSANGTWAVGGAYNDMAYRWSEATGVQYIGAGLYWGDSAVATAISADGRVIIGTSHSWDVPATWGSGFVWTEDLGLVDLTQLALSEGIDLEGVTLAIPETISGDGQTIAGMGSNGQGFILHLPTSLVPVPEPGTMLMMAMGMGALLARRAKRKDA